MKWPRHLRQFSLRRLVLAVALVSMALGLLNSRWFRQHRAVATIRSAGGIVYYDYQFASYFARQASGRQPAAGWLRTLLTDDFFHDVPFVDLRNAQGVDLELLTTLSGLKVLVVNGDQLGETPPELLSRLRHLEAIEIGGPSAELASRARQIRTVLPDCRVDTALGWVVKPGD